LRQRGLSLIELMIAIAMLALVMGLGLPSMLEMVDGNRVARQATWLQSDLRLARAEAVRRGAPVAMCTSTNGSGCTANSSWRDGWIVFSNRLGDGNFNAGSGDEILRVQPAWSGTDTAVTTPDAARVAFNAEGFSANLRGGNTTITIKPHSGSERSTRCLVLNLAGTVTMQGGAACP
jgi:type IV fimbrial biogenesis protein FimT